MSILLKRLMRHGLVLLSTAAAWGCSSEGGSPPTGPGSISLSLSETSATVVQGGSQMVTATLTRIGGFTGPVDLTVTGAEAGVTATVSNVQNSGSVTTAIVTLIAGAAAPAVYPLVVHGSGSGVGEVTQAFTLTVIVHAPLGFSISLSDTALSIKQGASTPTTTVTITRYTHIGSVGLYMTGLPGGVTASFDPTSWPAGYSTVLTLTVGAAASPGRYNLEVNAYDPEQEGNVSMPLTLTVMALPGYSLTLTAPVLSVAQASSSPLPTLSRAATLTITVTPFVLALSSSTLSIAQGTSTPTTVNVDRNNSTGPVTLSLGWYGQDHDILPPGATAAFAPNPATGNSSVLTLTVGAAAGMH